MCTRLLQAEADHQTTEDETGDGATFTVTWGDDDDEDDEDGGGTATIETAIPLAQLLRSMVLPVSSCRPLTNIQVED